MRRRGDGWGGRGAGRGAGAQGSPRRPPDTARPEDHSPTILIINDQKGFVTRTYGLARPSQIIKIIDDAAAGVAAADAKP